MINQVLGHRDHRLRVVGLDLTTHHGEVDSEYAYEESGGNLPVRPGVSAGRTVMHGLRSRCQLDRDFGQPTGRGRRMKVFFRPFGSTNWPVNSSPIGRREPPRSNGATALGGQLDPGGPDGGSGDEIGHSAASAGICCAGNDGILPCGPPVNLEFTRPPGEDDLGFSEARVTTMGDENFGEDRHPGVSCRPRMS